MHKKLRFTYSSNIIVTGNQIFKYIMLQFNEWLRLGTIMCIEKSDNTLLVNSNVSNFFYNAQKIVSEWFYKKYGMLLSNIKYY